MVVYPAPYKRGLHERINLPAPIFHRPTRLRRKSPQRLTFSSIDRLVFAGLYRLAPGVLDALKVVRPETVIRWHRAGFRAYWRWKSRARGGRPKTPLEIRHLIRKMSLANPLWGAPRIHGELLKLGIDVRQTAVAKDMGGEGDRRPKGGRRSFIITPRNRQADGAIGCFIHRADLDYCRVHYEMILVLVQLFSFYKRYRYRTSAVAPLGLVLSLFAVRITLFTDWKGEECDS